MINRFKAIAEELEIPLIYAQPDLANIKIDELCRDDFGDSGHLLVVTPLRSSLAVDAYNRVRRSFEIGILAYMDIDYDEEELDAIAETAVGMLKKVVARVGGILNTINIIDSAYDAQLGGVYTVVVVRPTEEICINYEQ